MRQDSGNGAAAVAIGLIIILLLSVGGVGAYYLVSRQQAALAMQAEQARLAEAQARMLAEAARFDAEAAHDARERSDGVESSIAQNESIRAAVESVLRVQEEAWNRGDVDAFMEHYLKSDELTFSSGGKITRGWTATLNRYLERYPTPDKMGQVNFTNLEVTPLGDSAAMVLGQWNLEREGDPLSGNFTLVLLSFDGRWLIVHDHTSRTAE